MSLFGENLKELRRSRGYTQEKFAEIIKSNQASITAWERGTRMPTLSKIQEIADIFRVPLSSLIGVQTSGNEDDEIRELIDMLKSNQKLRDLYNKVRYLSDEDLDVICRLANALTKEK